jgi:RNA polymerase sigma-70 factor (ECF subfamily)
MNMTHGCAHSVTFPYNRFDFGGHRSRIDLGGLAIAMTEADVPDRPAHASLTETPSVELIRRVREGDKQALDCLFARYVPVLRRWATGRLPLWARTLVDTDDLIQETLIKTFRNLDDFAPRHDGAFGAYLRLSINNRIRDEIRKVNRSPQRVELRDDQRGGGASPLEEAIGSEALERYEAALLKLTEDDRALVLTRVEMGLSYKDIASATNRPNADAARMAVSRALLKLASEMDHE